ncbi:MAG TPA: A24 family peptidase [Dehalococcoidia bacterium]|nr:A24 family peptidase [Dehalococcoidia bacterium]
MEVVIVGVIGLLCGHAIDLLWGRFYTGEQIIRPLHRCAECKTPSKPLYLLPFGGLLWGGARCPDCGASLNLRAIYLPVAAVLLFIVSWDSFGRELGAGVLGGFFATIFFTLALTDLETRLLPNRIIYPSILLAIAFCWAWPDTSVTEILAGGGIAVAISVALLLLSLPFGSDAFGMGDVKMIVLMGFVLGIPSVLVAVVLGTLAAGVGAALLLVTGLRGRKDYIPHGPFLSIGAILALWWGANIWDAYTG